MKLATNLRHDLEKELSKRGYKKDKDGTKFVFGKTFDDVSNFLEARPETRSNTRDPNKGVRI